MKDEYIIWSDGVLTSMGIKQREMGCGSILVKNPVNIVFSTEQKVAMGEDGKETIRSVMRFDMTPYLFGACLDSGNNIWECKPAHVLVDGTPAEDIVKAYLHTIEVTSKRPGKK